MRRDKVGEPFQHPNTFLLLLGHAKAYFHLPYRQAEGTARGHSKGKLPSIPDYRTTNRRINRLDIKAMDDGGKELKDGHIIIAIEHWRQGNKRRSADERKWKVRKGQLKIRVAVNVKSKKILSARLTYEHVHDGKVLPELAENITKSNRETIGRLLADDGACDGNDVFRCLPDNGIYPSCVKTRKNSRARVKTGHILRNPSVLSQRNDSGNWKDSASYGRRRMAETVFSSIKRTFGEHAYSAKFENMAKGLAESTAA